MSVTESLHEIDRCWNLKNLKIVCIAISKDIFTKPRVTKKFLLTDIDALRIYNQKIKLSLPIGTYIYCILTKQYTAC